MLACLQASRPGQVRLRTACHENCSPRDPQQLTQPPQPSHLYRWSQGGVLQCSSSTWPSLWGTSLSSLPSCSGRNTSPLSSGRDTCRGWRGQRKSLLPSKASCTARQHVAPTCDTIHLLPPALQSANRLSRQHLCRATPAPSTPVPLSSPAAQVPTSLRATAANLARTMSSSSARPSRPYTTRRMRCAL